MQKEIRWTSQIDGHASYEWSKLKNAGKKGGGWCCNKHYVGGNFEEQRNLQVISATSFEVFIVLAVSWQCNEVIAFLCS